MKTILAWPKKGSNPYNEILYEEIEKQDNIKVLSHREHRFAGVFYKVDFFHFHWINAYLNHKPLKAFVATMMFMLYIKILKLKKTKIIWTVHNSASFTHHGKNKWLENFLIKFLFKNVDVFIIHSKFQKKHLPKYIHDKIVWIPHHNYCSILDEKIENPSKDYFLFFGGVDKYKGLEDAIEAYKKSKQKLPFKIIGRVSSSKYKQYLMKLIKNEKNIIFEDKFVNDEELEVLVKNAYAVILPFKKITNSGSLIYALSCKTNVIMRETELFNEFKQNYNIKCLVGFNSLNELVEKFDNLKFLNGCEDYIKKTDISYVFNSFYKRILTK